MSAVDSNSTTCWGEGEGGSRTPLFSPPHHPPSSPYRDQHRPVAGPFIAQVAAEEAVLPPRVRGREPKLGARHVARQGEEVGRRREPVERVGREVGGAGAGGERSVDERARDALGRGGAPSSSDRRHRGPLACRRIPWGARAPRPARRGGAHPPLFLPPPGSPAPAPASGAGRAPGTGPRASASGRRGRSRARARARAARAGGAPRAWRPARAGWANVWGRLWAHGGRGREARGAGTRARLGRGPRGRAASLPPSPSRSPTPHSRRRPRFWGRPRRRAPACARVCGAWGAWPGAARGPRRGWGGRPLGDGGRAGAPRARQEV